MNLYFLDLYASNDEYDQDSSHSSRESAPLQNYETPFDDYNQETTELV